MNKGKRYDHEQKLNIKKVIAVVIALLVLCMFGLGVKKLLNVSGTDIDTSNIRYYTVYSDNKYGVINSKGEEVIAPAYAEYIVIPDHKKDVFICTYDVDYENGTYKTSVLDKNAEGILKGYELVEAIDNYDEGQNIWYEENVLRVKKDGKYGLINFSGKELLKCEYDSIESLKGVENSILVKKDGKLGIVNNTGRKVVDVKYDAIKPLTKDYMTGYIVIKDNQYGVSDISNKIIIDVKYEDIKQISGDGIFVVKEDAKWKVVDKKGKILLDEQIDDISEIGNNIVFIKDAKYGVITKEGAEVIPAEYEDLKEALDNTYIAKQERKIWTYQYK